MDHRWRSRPPLALPLGGAGAGAEIVGRVDELTILHQLVDDPLSADRPMLIVGEAGIGKSVLLEATALRARDAGATVLYACGSETESEVAFAGLHQVLRPVLRSAEALPERLRTALLGAFGVVDGGGEPLFLRLATLALLTTAESVVPVVVVLDDVHWLDRSSLEVLAFVARRQAGEPVTIVAAARSDAIPAGLEAFTVLELPALDTSEADYLLDLQPRRLTGVSRSRVVDQSAGNPLALVELAKVASDGLLGSDRFVEMLPLTHRLQQLYTGALERLPAESRALLLLTAAADNDELRLLPPSEPGAWALAEQANLVDLDGTAVRFRHPLVRAAVYHAATSDERRSAHRLLADRLRAEPDRRAWHLAAAAEGPDEAVAAALDATAQRALERGAFSSSARTLERAADLSPRQADAARRLALAADVAVNAGQPAWVLELATRAVALGGDPTVIALARHRTAYVAIYSAQRDAAFDSLLSLAEDLVGVDPAGALAALVTAANVAYNTASLAQRRGLLRVLDLLGEGSPTSSALPATWVLAATDPFDHRDLVLARLDRLVERRREGQRDELAPWTPYSDAGVPDLPRLDPAQLSIIGAAAWAVDEPQLAVATLSEVLAAMRSRGVVGPNVGVLIMAASACVDLGRWEEALELVDEAMVVAEAAELDTLALNGRALQALVAALRGDQVAARAKAALTLATGVAQGLLSVAVSSRMAFGLAATAIGDHDAAWTHFRSCFTPDGEPVHFHLSYSAIADLAGAASRTGNVDVAADIVATTAGRLDGKSSARISQLLSRAAALLAGSSPSAEEHFRAALDSAAHQWPFERAQVQLDFGEWLRRQRRAREARPVLAAAVDAFTLLGSAPWASRAGAELRAAGVAAASADSTGFSALTAQEQEIVRLAAQGLTNREIGARLFLAARTVGSHLYHVFPKLNVTSRSQLRAVIEQETSAAGVDAGA